jgi:hypothetical protein
MLKTLCSFYYCEQMSVHLDISGCVIINGNDQPERVARTDAFLVDPSILSESDPGVL